MLYNKFDYWWYDVCKKHKWCDWIDDHIVWYVYTKPRILADGASLVPLQLQ